MLLACVRQQAHGSGSQQEARLGRRSGRAGLQVQRGDAGHMRAGHGRAGGGQVGGGGVEDGAADVDAGRVQVHARAVVAVRPPRVRRVAGRDRQRQRLARGADVARVCARAASGCMQSPAG